MREGGREGADRHREHEEPPLWPPAQEARVGVAPATLQRLGKGPWVSHQASQMVGLGQSWLGANPGPEGPVWPTADGPLDKKS